jgi:hypothetical protein
MCNNLHNNKIEAMVLLLLVGEKEKKQEKLISSVVASELQAAKEQRSYNEWDNNNSKISKK